MTGSETEIRLQIVALLPRLRRFAFALTGRQDEADDLVQSACLKALDRLSQFEFGTKLDSWMFRIVQTTFLDDVRSRSRRAKDTVINEDINASDSMRAFMSRLKPEPILLSSEPK